MDTFSHIIIGFLIFAKYDLRLAFIAGFMAMFVDLDILIYPLGLKFPIFEHRGIVHAIPIAIVYTAIVAFVFMFLTKLNYALILIGYRMICLCGLPALGAGSRRFKSSRPDQSSNIISGSSCELSFLFLGLSIGF